VLNLTRREIQVCELVGAGYTCPEIAEQLDISVRTVEAHVRNAARQIPGRGGPMTRILKAFSGPDPDEAESTT